MNSTSNTAPTPLAAALAEIEKAAIARMGRIQRQDVARDLNVVKSAVSAWFRGRQVPREQHLEGLAKVYSGGDDALYQQYHRALLVAAGGAIPAGAVLSGARRHQTVMERIQTPGGNLNIGIAHFPHFSAFFWDVLDTFAKYCSLAPFMQEIPLERLPHMLMNGDTDVGASFFATPDRAVFLRFLPSPIKVGVNALTFARAAARSGFSLQKDPRGGPSVVPITNPKEVGDLYARYFLGYRHEIIESAYSVEAFANTLLDEFARWLPNEKTQPPPVIFVDELMSLLLHKELLGRLIKATGEITLESVGVPIRLMGEGILLETQQIPITFNPNYSIAICVSRKSTELFNFLAEAWNIFLSSNINYLALRYAELFDDLNRITNDIKTMTLEGRYQADVKRKWKNGFMGTLDLKLEMDDFLVKDWDNLIRAWLGVQQKGHSTDFDNRNQLPHPWPQILAKADEIIESRSQKFLSIPAKRRQS